MSNKYLKICIFEAISFCNRQISCYYVVVFFENGQNTEGVFFRLK